MNSKSSMLSKYSLGLALAVMMASMLSCNTSPKRGQRQGFGMNQEELLADSALTSNVQSIRQIFYSLPSPLETALILKRAGATYDEHLL
ncbi:MAG: hypothetical protein IJU72_03960, partial [Bacteroidales bacterium]|nr:hypothetical protein [Bacteroidales bacterium]